jgi:hypothetical protein
MLLLLCDRLLLRCDRLPTVPYFGGSAEQLKELSKELYVRTCTLTASGDCVKF